MSPRRLVVPVTLAGWLLAGLLVSLPWVRAADPGGSRATAKTAKSGGDEQADAGTSAADKPETDESSAESSANDTVESESAAPRADRNSPDGIQDLVFMGPLRPLLIRLHVTIDGQAFRDVWSQHFERALDDLDRDHDGNYTSEQFPDLLRLVNGNGADGTASGANVEELTRLASTTQGKLTHAAALQWLEGAAAPFAVAVGSGRRLAGPALFPLLDANVDQHLTKEELADAPTRLSARDFNDNEIITMQELQAAPPSSGVRLAPESGAASAATPSVGTVVLVDRRHPEALGADIVARYDRNRDSRLTVADDDSSEISFPVDLVKQLDANADGALDAAELSAVAQSTPDLDLEISLGRGRISRSSGSGSQADHPDWKVKRKVDGSYALDVNDAQIELRRNNRNPASDQDGQPQFGDFDADENEYLDETEAKNNPTVAEAFKSMDADGDGKVYAPEFRAYFRRLGQSSACRLVLEVADQGQELFALLDTDHDNRLTQRELRTAHERLREEDKNNDGRLGGNEIPQHVRLELSRGTPALIDAGAATPAARRRRGSTAARTPSDAPSWFAKMDRNEDGDISPREFLGSADVFRKLDTNHDLLIDANEAKAAEQLRSAPAAEATEEAETTGAAAPETTPAAEPNATAPNGSDTPPEQE